MISDGVQSREGLDRLERGFAAPDADTAPRERVEVILSAMSRGKSAMFDGARRHKQRSQSPQRLTRSGETTPLEADLRSLLAALPEATLLVDSGGEVRFANATADELFGYRPGELTGLPIEALVPQRSRAAHAAMREGYASHPKSRAAGVGLDLRGVRRDGVEFAAEVRLEPVELGSRPSVLATVRQVGESEEWYRAIFEQAAVGVVHTDIRGVFVNANAKFCEISGYSREEILALGVRDVVHRDDLLDSLVARRRILGGAVSSYERELRLIKKAGACAWTSVTTSLVRGASGRRAHFMSLIQDISERKRADISIRHLNRVYAVLSAINGLIIRAGDRDELFREAARIAVDSGEFRLAWLGLVDGPAPGLRIVAWRGAGGGIVEAMSLAHLGVPSSESGASPLSPGEWAGLVENDVAGAARVALREQLLTAGLLSFAQLPLVVGGQVRGVLALYAGEAGFFDEREMRLLRELAGDIAFALDHLEKASRVNYLAYYDQLTGLANRTLFAERLSQSIETARVAKKPLAVVLTDMERLGSVNDSFGRQAGDQVLKQMAERLCRLVEKSRLGRTSGGGFAIVLDGFSEASELEGAIEAIWREAFGEVFRAGAAEVRLSARAGIAVSPQDGGDAESLLRAADAALRIGKQTHEKRVYHMPDMTRRNGEKLSMECQLRGALDRGELQLHYQPKVDFETGRVAGVEALMRWNSRELGLVPPARFIPILEETGMILEAGAWALAQAVADHRAWQRMGLLAPPVAVNVSAVQLRKRDFIGDVSKAMDRGGGPAAIELEITESVIMEDLEGNTGKLKALRELGIALAIDDFGTGYSSLAYLAKLPAQALKIDRSFIQSMLDDRDTMTVVQTIISLAHSLRLKVVAEAVESQEQAKILRLLRCDEMQGFLFSPPVVFDGISSLLRQDAARLLADAPGGWTADDLAASAVHSAQCWLK